MTRPNATVREVKELLRGLGAAGTIQEAQIHALLRSGAVRTLQKNRKNVSAAIALALKRMQTAGELNVTDPKDKGRTKWGRPEDNTTDPLEFVLRRLRRWISTRTREGHRITVTKARSQWKKQHAKAGGKPEALTETIKEHMRGMALRGEMIPAPNAHVLLNLFSGGQSADAPARASGLTPVHVDMAQQYPLAPGRTVLTRASTDLRKAPDRKMIPWVASREGFVPEEVLIAAAAIPCHTWTHLDAVLRPSGHNFRTKAGNPNTSNPPKAQEAREQTALAQNTTLSIFDWIFQGAYIGTQRYCWLENGAWGKLGDQPFMESLPAP